MSEKEQEYQKTEEACDTANIQSEEGEKKKSILGTVIKTVLFIALWAFIIAICLRACQADHKELDELHITDEFKEAYKISTDVRTHAAGTEFSENGALYAYSFVYIPKAGYLQVTVRYNRHHISGVIDALNQNARREFGENAPTYTENDISISYTVTDSNGKEYAVKELASAEKYNYVYRKLEITGIEFKEAVDSEKDIAVSIDMILHNVDKIEVTVDGKKTTTLAYREGESTNAGTTLEAHTIDDTYIPYEFSSSEKKELE